MYTYIYIYSRTPAFGGISLDLRGRGALGATFGRLRHPRQGVGGAHLGNRRLRGDKKIINKIWGAFGAPNGFESVTRSTKIPNMCLVLKLDNGKVVSIANEQTDVTSSTVLVYRCLQCLDQV